MIILLLIISRARIRLINVCSFGKAQPVLLYWQKCFPESQDTFIFSTFWNIEFLETINKILFYLLLMVTLQLKMLLLIWWNKILRRTKKSVRSGVFFPYSGTPQVTKPKHIWICFIPPNNAAFFQQREAKRICSFSPVPTHVDINIRFFI